MAKVACKETHIDVDTRWTCRNWRNNYDGTSTEMFARAAPMRSLAESVNRILGRYPMMSYNMAWPITGETNYAGDSNGSAPLVNWGRHDYIPNARAARIKIKQAWRCDNQVNSDYGGAYVVMSANYQENVAPYSGTCRNIATGTNYVWETSIPQIIHSRGDEANAWQEFGLNTYGGYQILDICMQDEELPMLEANSAIHDYCLPTQATAHREVLSDLAASIRSAFHTARMHNQGFQSSWSGLARSNAWQYPSTTDVNAIVVHSDTFVNLINQAWTSRNADSPGIDCKAYQAGVGHTGNLAGQIVTATVAIFAEYNAAGPAGAGAINVVGPIYEEGEYVNVPANTGATTQLGWVFVNTQLNSLLGYTDQNSGGNKIDIFGKVQNSGDTLYVRGWTVYTDYN